MKDKVMDTILGYKLIQEKDNIVIGVSGGPDSMALLYVLLDIKNYIDFNIIVAHINHDVRGDEAKRDEEFVGKIAKKLNLAYYSKKEDMVEYGKKKGISSEEAGREIRYGFFNDILKEYGKGKIAVAHNLNDQAETLLMRFMRGTGIDGLKGMDFISGNIIRPILNINRLEIEKYIEDNEIETVLDRTNLESIYTRNRIRLDLIPYIEEYFNPNIINTLWRTSQIASIDSEFLEEYSREKYKNIMKKEEANSIILNSKYFKSENRSIQQRIIRLTLEKIHGNLQGFSEQQIMSIWELFNSGETGKEVHLSNNLIARTSYEDLIIEINNINLLKDYSYPIKLDHINYLKDIGYTLEAKVLPIEEVNLRNIGKDIKYFDFHKIKGEIYIRNRRDGDRFNPFGMKGTKKIKNYFIDEKIPKELRDEIPLLVDNENILWVIGYRTSELYRITKETKKVLLVEFHKQD